MLKKRKSSNPDLLLSQKTKIPLSEAGNTLVIGGVRSGKTRNYVIANILQCHANYIVTDSCYELAKSLTPFLESSGYDVQTIPLVPMYHQEGHTDRKYNPFYYINTSEDISTMKDALLFHKKEIDPYIKQVCSCILMSFIGYIHTIYPLAQQNLVLLVKEIRNIKTEFSTFNKKFENCRTEYSDTFWFHSYEMISEELREILWEASDKLLDVLSPYEKAPKNGTPLFATKNTLDLDSFSTKPTVIFLELHPCDKSYYPMLSMFLCQIINYFYSSRRHSQPIHIMLDEYHPFQYIRNFEEILAVSRGYHISFSILYQNIPKFSHHIVNSFFQLLFMGRGNAETCTYLQQLSKDNLSIKTIKELPRDKVILFRFSKENSVKVEKKCYLNDHPKYKKIS